jgi:hypothetical protein
MFKKTFFPQKKTETTKMTSSTLKTLSEKSSFIDK